jgi:hypothetical protein
MPRFRFTLELEGDSDSAGRAREAAVDAVSQVDGIGKVTGHVVRDVQEGDDWDKLPLLEK